MYALHFRLIYSFYRFGEELISEAVERVVPVTDAAIRFTLDGQEDGSFLVSELTEGVGGKYVVLTHPNKDSQMICEGVTEELAYDEYYSVMGDDNHNVWEGAVTLERVEG